MSFTTEGGEYGDSAMGVDLGMMGARADTGRVRAITKKEVRRITLSQNDFICLFSFKMTYMF